MITAWLLAAIAAVAQTPKTETPTPAGLFDRAIAAVGPVERVPTLHAEGSIEDPSGRSSIEVLWSARAPRRLLVRVKSAAGAVSESGCDGTRGWMIVPGRADALDVEPAAILAANAGLVPPLMVMALADRFPQRTLGPDETIDGVRCTRVDLEDRDGMPGAAWFEVASGRLRAFRTQRRRSEPAMTTTITEWTSVGPLTLPATLRSVRDGKVTQLRFDRIRADPIEAGAFAPSVSRPS